MERTLLKGRAIETISLTSIRSTPVRCQAASSVARLAYALALWINPSNRAMADASSRWKGCGRNAHTFG